MKLFHRKYIILGISLIAVSLLSVAAISPDFKIAKNLEILFNLFREVNMYYVDESDPDKMLENSAKGMLSGLDPYTEFMSESDMENFEILTTGKYGGIGSLIRKKGEWIEIAQPYKGFAADNAGLKIGDKIIEIEGKEMRNATSESVSGLMKGEPGTILKMKVQRIENDKIVELKIKRERISISGVPYYGMLNDSIGYVVHDNFSENCSNDIKSAVVEMKKHGMKALVIDLRGNGGGILQEAVKIVGMFVPKNTEVVSIKGKSKDINAVYKTTIEPIDTSIRIAVLINRGSASASEIVSGALQDVDRAILIGQRSFGKGLVQTPRPVGYNAYVKLTTAKYYTPSGRCIQAIDYSNRNDDGSVGYIADSLIKEFKTTNGRKVYDGGGVMPDILSELPSISIFTLNLYANGYLEDFALEYLKKNKFKTTDLTTFSLKDDDYKNFVEFMQTRKVEFESETQVALDELKKTAEKEKYADRISEEIEKIKSKITKNKNDELAEFKNEISKLIEDEIVMYHHYSQGVIEHKLKDDSTVNEAIKTLSNIPAYYSILREKNTARR